MSTPEERTNFHNDQTYHVYGFLKKTKLVDLRGLLGEAGEAAEAETTKAEAREAEETEVDDEGVDEEGVDEEGVDEEGVDEEGVDEEGVDEETEEADAKAEAEAAAERAEIVADLTFEHFVDALKYWFESECWSLIDNYSFSPDEWCLGAVGDASDIETDLLLPLAAAASQEIYWNVIAETLLKDFDKMDEDRKI